MAERKSPTAVLREGPRALSDGQVREIEDSALTEVLHIAAQIEDEARHTVFFDRFYREVVGLKGDIMAVLDASFPWVSETFVAPFCLLAYQADELRLHPYDERARVRYGTNYFLWIEGVLAGPPGSGRRP